MLTESYAPGDDSSSDSGFESAAKDHPINASHRVVLSHLPKKTTIPQVLKLIRGPGGTIAADVYDTSNFPSPLGDCMAVVEFANPAAAETFVHFARQHVNFAFRDDSGALHKPKIWSPKTPSLPISPDCPRGSNRRDRFWIGNAITRCFKAFEFPVKAVWFCLCALGHDSSLVNAEYNHETATLSLEFVSLFAAHRAFRTINEGRFPYYYPNQLRFVTGNTPLTEFRPDSTDGDVCLLPSRVAEYIPPDHLENKFNCLPYNQVWPDRWFPIMRSQGLQPRPFQDHMLQMIQRYASLSRTSWSWEVAQDVCVDHARVMETLGDPAWKDAWDAFFVANRTKTQNLKRWEEYGGLARRRREKTTARGSLVGELSRKMPRVIEDFLSGKTGVRLEMTPGGEDN